MVQLFFVSGAPKSGTTWVQRLLDAHPEIICSGEGHFVTELVLPLLRLKQAYNKKLELVAERVYEGKPYYPAMTDADAAAAAAMLIGRQMAKRTKAGAKALGDKTPRYTDHLDLLGRLFPDARFIHVVRHPCDVAVSLLHHALRAGYADALDQGSKTYLDTVGNACRAWASAQEKAQMFAAQRPGFLTAVRYEDLSADPLPSATRLFTHLGVDASEAAAAAAVQAASFETLSGRARGEENPRSFFRKGVSGDWTNRLDAQALAVVEEACGVQLRRDGYEFSVGESANL